MHFLTPGKKGGPDFWLFWIEKGKKLLNTPPASATREWECRPGPECLVSNLWVGGKKEGGGEIYLKRREKERSRRHPLVAFAAAERGSSTEGEGVSVFTLANQREVDGAAWLIV